MGSSGPSTREQIGAIHGDRCWLCNGKLLFEGDAPDSKRATIEHLNARSHAGGNDLANLRLCHRACNQRLSNKSVAEKEAMRVKFQRDTANNQARMAAARASAKPNAGKPAKVPMTPAPVAKGATLAPVGTAATPRAESAMPGPSSATVRQHDGCRAGPAYWQRVAMIAMASATFFAGLCLGLLIG